MNIQKHATYLFMLIMCSFIVMATTEQMETQELNIPEMEETEPEITELQYMESPNRQLAQLVCDHNFDGTRDILDWAIFGAHQNTFDVNGDGVHNLLDLALYAENNNDDEWCFEHKEQFGWVEEPQNISIQLTGANPQYIELGQAYVELGAEVMNGDQDLLVINTDKLDSTLVGSYHVLYEYASDTSHYQVSPVIRTVIVQDITAPVITVEISPNSIDEGERFTITVNVQDESIVNLEGIVELDNDVVEAFTQSNVETQTQFQYRTEDTGRHYVTVTATDEHGNQASKEVSINVEERQRSSSGSRGQGNVGDIRVIYHEDTQTSDEEQTSSEEVHDNTIEIQTIDSVSLEGQSVLESEDTYIGNGNLITGAAVGEGDDVSKTWLYVLIVIAALAVLAIMYVTVWSKK